MAEKEKLAYVEPNIPKKLLSPYNPSETEQAIYAIEEKSGFFNPDKCIEAGITNGAAESYSIILPPPNVTGVLHLGHALGITIQDILIRFERMRGKKVLWIPGTDHAAIATQAKVEKEIYKKEGKNRYDLGREELLKRISEYATNSHDTIINQTKRIGASCDWSREAFTLDEARNKAVRTIFKKMYDDGLIYRGNRIVNWDPKGQTTISDDEIVYEERPSTLYTFKYSKDFPIPVSTTRLETKIGDTAVAVHPEDERYIKYIGETFTIDDFCGEKLNIRIIADASVEKEFGTGAVGVTPAHSLVDFDMLARNYTTNKKENMSAEVKQVIDEHARMIVGESSPLYNTEKKTGMKTTEARETIAEWLRTNGLMIKEESITQNVSTAERTGGIIEPLPKLQWFIGVNRPFKVKHSEIKGITTGTDVTLKEIMVNAVEGKQVEILPEHFNKTYTHWVDNLRDWCISRQIWYGHRIPVWYKGDEIYCDVEAPKGDGWEQDPDTLDTWFSSGLWTFSTMGWPDAYDETTFKAKALSDLARFHPTNTLVPAYEILFFWVARMILMTGYALGTVPYKKVYLTGVVRDSQGRKMSKSLGNGGDPIEISDKYGADALRMFYAVATTPGMDSRMYDDKIKGYKHFANKVWNVARFILTATSEPKVEYDGNFSAWSLKDLELIASKREIITAITAELEEYKIHLAAEKIYHYIWSTLADIILEESKIIFKDGTPEEKASRAQFLLHTLRDIVKILHPFMPFVTEELWSILTSEQGLTEKGDTIKDEDLLLIQSWPL